MRRAHWGGPGEDYRLKKLSATAIGEASSIGSPAPDEAAPVWQTPKAQHSFPWLEIVLTAAGIIGLIGLTVFFLSPVASSYLALVKTTLLALIPLGIVLAFLHRLDRWAPAPWKTKVAVSLWGAGIATLSSGIVNTALGKYLDYSLGNFDTANALSTTFVAPLVEETLKAIGVIIVVVVRRTNINSVLDGAIYGGLSAAGFMFTEDILYYLRGEPEGTAHLLWLVALRGLMSPFLHVMATSMTGIGLALALLSFKNGWMRAGIVTIFWVCAMLIHLTWNGSAAYFGDRGFYTMYGVIYVPGFILWALLLLRATRQQRAKIRKGLVPYVRTGWVLPGEVTMAIDKRVQKASIKWSTRGGRDATRAMRSFLANLASLGLDQCIMAQHGPDPARIDADRQKLATVVENRREFLRLTSIADQQNVVSQAVTARTRNA